MIQIRRNVFETNSSSTHSLCICTKQQYYDFKNGKLLYYEYDGCLITPEEAKDKLNEYRNRAHPSWEDETHRLSLRDIDIYNVDEWYCDNDDLEEYCENFTTPSGDEIVVFGFYGERY